MKNYLLTLFFSLSAGVAVSAQESKLPNAFNCEEGCWLTGSQEEFFIFPENIEAYRMCNDTVIDGKVWKKMYLYKMRYDEFRTMNIDFSSLEYGDAVGCLRYDNGKIYGMVLDNNRLHTVAKENTPVLLYDFSKEVGDDVEIYDWYEGSDTYGEVMGYEKMSKDIFYGYERKCYITANLNVEGLGSIYNGPFGCVIPGVTGYDPLLMSCSADGEAIYKSDIMPVDILKYAYDLLYNSLSLDYYDDAKWVVGRIKDEKVIETYTLKKYKKDYDQYVVSSLEPAEKKVIDYGRKSFGEPDGKVYCKTGDTEYLLYDFKLKEGETFDNGIRRMTVTSVDTLMIEGFERPVITFDNGEQWIDGLGSTRGLLSSVTEESAEYEEVLLSCIAGSTVMYSNSRYGSGIDTVESSGSTIMQNGTMLEINTLSSSRHTVVIYDAGGCAVMQHTFDGMNCTLSLTSLNNGVYIVVVDGTACGKIAF